MKTGSIYKAKQWLSTYYNLLSQYDNCIVDEDVFVVNINGQLVPVIGDIRRN